jgi:hypothetical protein
VHLVGLEPGKLNAVQFVEAGAGGMAGFVHAKIAKDAKGREEAARVGRRRLLLANRAGSN